MNQDASQEIKSSDWQWLVFISISAITVMILGIENVLERRLSFALLSLYTVFPIIVTRSFRAVGITKNNIRSSILVGSGVGILYGVARGLMLRFIPNAGLIFGADLIRIAPRLESGIQIGPLLMAGYWMILIPILLGPFMMGIELYFRGFLFLNLKRHIPWTGAVAVASIVQAISRRTPHSLIMGSIAGVLMQKYDNILAPTFMHGFQFFVALAIFAYS